LIALRWYRFRHNPGGESKSWPTRRFEQWIREGENVVLKRSILLAVAAVTLGIGATLPAAKALAIAPVPQSPASPAAEVRWVCGQDRCYWRPNYAGHVATYPWMVGWGPPPSPRCYYAKRRGQWTMVC
jgi:hypothetical protein